MPETTASSTANASATTGDPQPVPARSLPRLLPETRKQRWCLALLLVFVVLKGLLWSVTVPYFWGADEDYHFLYVESLTTQQQLPSPDRPLYPREYEAVATAIHYDAFGGGPRENFDGDPKESVRKLGELPDSARDPVDFGRGVGVVHPPLYALAGAAVNAAAGDASVATRITLVRWVSPFIGALAVYFAWLLAAQVLRRFAFQFGAAFLVAVQPIFSYMTGVVNHDVALVASVSAALALMLFLLRSPPRTAQGAWLGAALVAALLVKATAVVLLPVAALAFVGQWLVHRDRWREVAKSAGLAALVVLVLAAWWYVRSKLVYGSFTGATTSLSDPALGTLPPGERGLMASSPSELIASAREWMALTYRTYWWHYLWFDAPSNRSPVFYVPMLVGALGMLGLVRVAWTKRRTLLAADDPLLRQVALMVAAILVIIVPFLGVDMMRRADGLGFMVNGGRYLIPTFGAVAVLMVIGLRGLVGRRLHLPAVVIVCAIASVFVLRVYDDQYLNRYWGHYANEGLSELLRRLSFDRPEFVTPATIAIVAVLAVLAAAGAWALAASSEREESRTRHRPAAPLDSVDAL